MELELIFPNEEYRKEVELFKKNMLDNNSRMDGCGSLRIDDFDTWLERCIDYKDGKNTPNNMPPYIQYICIRKNDNKVIGMLQIRHKEINPIFGNIGYCIAFDERGKGYSKMMLKLGLKECKKLNLDKVMINCLVTNEASRRCILANGGVLLDRMFVKERNYDIERYYIYLDKGM
ncbi:MAG: GNAT family N-acetyltransferase [Bacilli bacterium]|nr:GNAT family N-acetyltransferase [Bacilli bacterium]